MKNKFFFILAACVMLFIFSGLTFAQEKCTEENSVKRVSKSRSGNFEYVTFDVGADAPEYSVTNAKRPFQMYGDEKILRIKGNFFKSIVFRGVYWTCVIGQNLKAATSQIMDVKNIEQFEGQVEYIIGYRAKSKYVGVSMTGTGSNRHVVLKFKR